MIRLPLLLFLLLVGFGTQAWCDGGVIVFSRTSGSYRVTLFAAPAPVRIGQTDWSVLLQDDGTGTPLLDAKVHLTLNGSYGQAIETELDHARATNKLLYASTLSVPAAGSWKATISWQQGARHGFVSEPIGVLDEEGALGTYWPYFAVVPLGVLLFFLHRHLQEQRLRLER